MILPLSSPWCRGHRQSSASFGVADFARASEDMMDMPLSSGLVVRFRCSHMLSHSPIYPLHFVRLLMRKISTRWHLRPLLAYQISLFWLICDNLTSRATSSDIHNCTVLCVFCVYFIWTTSRFAWICLVFSQIRAHSVESSYSDRGPAASVMGVVSGWPFAEVLFYGSCAICWFQWCPVSCAQNSTLSRRPSRLFTEWEAACPSEVADFQRQAASICLASQKWSVNKTLNIFGPNFGQLFFPPFFLSLFDVDLWLLWGQKQKSAQAEMLLGLTDTLAPFFLPKALIASALIWIHCLAHFDCPRTGISQRHLTTQKPIVLVKEFSLPLCLDLAAKSAIP